MQYHKGEAGTTLYDKIYNNIIVFIYYEQITCPGEQIILPANIL